ncbi:outer membrane protein assembly factor BamE [Kaarinaea lacus]
MISKAFVKFLLIINVLLALWGCTIHRMDIQQGNVLTQEILDKLVVGMEMRKVRGLAGTPLVSDPFRSDRWDYVYSFKHGITKEKQFSYVTLYFEKDILVEIKVHAEPLKREDINTLNRQLREMRS